MSNITADPWVVFAIIFAIGFVFGFILRPGGAKWRRKYEIERAAHGTLRREYDAHLARHAEPARPIEHDTLKSGSF